MTAPRKNDITWIALIIGWLLVIGLSIVLWNAKQVRKYLENNNLILKSNEVVFRNKIGTLTTQVGTYQLTQKELKENVIEKDEQLKAITRDFYRVNALLTFRASAVIDTAKVKFDMPIHYDPKTGDSIPEFLRTGNYEKDWLCFDYSFNNTGFDLYSTTATINIAAVTGFKRKWFLGKTYATTEITPMQKNVTVINVASYQTIVPVKWYNSKLFYTALGFGLCELKNRL